MAGTRVFVGMSGGVDSSVAAALLKERNFDVVGVFMKNWADPHYPCPWEDDRRDAMRVAAALGIPFQTWDFTEEYRRAVVDYMVREYAAGRTPNPDVMCNREIKFGVFLERALASGADYIATGHYVRREIREQGLETSQHADTELTPSRYSLISARDAQKDQSYFLWTLGQEQLQHCLFPIGEYTKPEVRAMARERNLPTAEKPDSQGICFIGEIDVQQFLRDHIPQRRGLVLTSGGRVVGEHDGLAFYTIGQREGLGIGGGVPYYVTTKDHEKNTLIVAEGPYDGKLFRDELVATDVRWVSGTAPTFPFKCEARIRYRQPLQSCLVTEFNQFNESESKLINSSTHQLRVMFTEPQRAVTPGQSIVFYRGEPFDSARGREMLGGGVIA